MSLPDDTSEESIEELTVTAKETPDLGGGAGGRGVSVSSVSNSASSATSAYQMYDRLVFIAVPLAVVIKNGAEVQSKTEPDFDSFSAFEGNVKPQLLVESGLQNMV